MTTLSNLYQQTRMNPLQEKSVFQYDGSYRIFYVTTRTKDDSDEEIDNLTEKDRQIIVKDEGKRRKFSKKSFRLSHRSGINNWKRKSNRNKSPSPSHLSPMNHSNNNNNNNNTNRSINSNDRRSSFPSNNKEKRTTTDEDDGTQLTDADLLIGAIDQSLTQDDATLHNLLARADQLETNFKKQDFNKIQPTVVRPSLTRKRKRQILFIIILVVILLALISIGSIVILVLWKKQKRNIPTFAALPSAI